MPLRGAVASGNWSNPAIWNGGVLPTVGDVVASNGFTVTIDQNINVDGLTNAAATDAGLTPAMTSDTTPSGVVSASTLLNSTYPAWRAFDKNNSTGWASNTTGPPQWLEYEFPSPTVVNRYVLRATNTDAPVTWEFQAWDGSSWVVLQSIVNAPKVVTDTTYNFTNTTAYSRYRMYMLAPYSQGYMFITELTLANSSALASAVAGGGFILNGGVTVQVGTFVTGGSKNLVECSIATGESATIIGNITGGTITGYSTINFSGSGILNIIGDLYVTNGNTGSYSLLITGLGTVNITGNVTSNDRNQVRGVVRIAGNCTLNVTGDVVWTLNGGLTTPSSLIRVESICTINVVGSVIGGPLFWAIGGTSITSNTTIYLSVIGPIIAREGNSSNSARPAIQNISGSSIIILTGPFISSGNGIQPLYVTRMHYRRTIGSYYEFRDNSTLGALPPSPPAPATRLVSPDTVADSPIPRDVRQGTIYADGSQTGTMIVPSRDNVAKGVLVDNTTGTAILDADSIWAVPLTSINTLNSIGRRVKNAATVESTGAQIQQTLNDNE